MPVGNALLGTVLAVVALCGTAVFGASLSHLIATPKLYGDSFQINFTNPAYGTGGPAARLLSQLKHDPDVVGITEGVATEVLINKEPVGAVAGTSIRGKLLFSTVDGHLPNGPGEIGLGVATMHEVGAHLGSIVHVTVSLPSGGRRTSRFRIVSQISFPVLAGSLSLGIGAAMTTADTKTRRVHLVADLACADGRCSRPSTVVVNSSSSCPAREARRTSIATSRRTGLLPRFPSSQRHSSISERR